MDKRRKITDIDQIHLIAMHAAGFDKEAQDHAMSLGCTKHYAAMLCHKLNQRLHFAPTQERNRLKWERAKAKGMIII